jgi:hypothetical protein
VGERRASSPGPMMNEVEKSTSLPLTFSMIPLMSLCRDPRRVKQMLTQQLVNVQFC